MSTLFKSISVFFLLGMAQSCEIEQLSNERQIVINDFFTANEPFTIEITESSSSFDTNTFIIPDDLDVLIYEGDQLLGNLDYTELPAIMSPEVSKISSIEKNIYYTNPLITPRYGKEYTIKVLKNDVVLAISKNSIPQPAQIIKVDTFSTTSVLYGLELPMMTFNIQFKDNENKSNFYAITYKLVENYNDTLILNHQAAEIWSKEAFSEYSYEYKNDSGFNGKYLVFTDELLTGNTVNFSFEITKIGIGGRTLDCKNTIVVYLYTISKEYYEYVKTYNIQKKVNEDLYSEPIQMITNIEGGLGIFAGCSNDAMVINIPDSYNHYFAD